MFLCWGVLSAVRESEPALWGAHYPGRVVGDSSRDGQTQGHVIRRSYREKKPLRKMNRVCVCVLRRRVVHKEQTIKSKRHSKSFSTKCQFCQEKNRKTTVFWKWEIYCQFTRPISKSFMRITILSLNNQIGRYSFLQSVLLKI